MNNLQQLSDEALVEGLVGCGLRAFDGSFIAVAAEIIFRIIARTGNTRRSDQILLIVIVDLAKKMDEVDSDLLEESKSIRALGREYHYLKLLLLRRMAGGTREATTGCLGA